MGRKKKYNFKGLARHSGRDIFEFEESLPINCFNCAFTEKCRPGGQISSCKVCPCYKPYKALQDLRKIFEYVPDDVLNDWCVRTML